MIATDISDYIGRVGPFAIPLWTVLNIWTWSVRGGQGKDPLQECLRANTKLLWVRL